MDWGKRGERPGRGERDGAVSTEQSARERVAEETAIKQGGQEIKGIDLVGG